MSTTVTLRNVVGKAVDVFLEAIVPLQRHFDANTVFFGGEVEDIRVDRRFVLVQIFNERLDAAFIAAKESMSYMKDLWSEEEKQEFAKLDKMGVKVYQVDKAPFIEKVQPMYANFAKDNPALAPMLADIQAAK